jgi:hypothetical protein
MTANVTITQLPAAGAITGAELVPIVQNGVTKQTTTGAIAASPSQTQTFLTLNQEPTLPNSRYLSTNTGLGLTDGGAQSFYRISLNGASGSLEAASTGIIVKTASNAVTSRQVSISGTGLSITDGNGVSGNPTLSLSGLAASFANLGGSGIVFVNSGTTAGLRLLTGTASQITITDADGIAGNPTFSLASNPIIPGTASMTIPIGTSAQQPVGTDGQIRFNSDTQTFDGYSAGSWRQFSVSGGVTSFSGDITGLTPSVPTSGAIVLGGVLIASNGGTGISSYATGDLLYANSSTTLDRIPIGLATRILTSSGTAPGWTDPTTITVGTAINLAGGTANQIPYQTGAGATSFLVAPTTANRFLKWDGSAFSWDVAGVGTVTSVDVSGGTTGLTTSGGPITSSGTITIAGTLVTGNGGTGVTGTPTNGQLLIGNGAGYTLGTITQGANITITNAAGSITIAAAGGNVSGSNIFLSNNFGGM